MSVHWAGICGGGNPEVGRSGQGRALPNISYGSNGRRSAPGHCMLLAAVRENAEIVDLLLDLCSIGHRLVD
jgi:hypothetical protein